MALGLMFGHGCGGKVADEAEPPAPPTSVPRVTPLPPPAGAQPAAMARPRPDRPRQPARPSDTGAASIDDVLLANCGQCHGPNLTPAQAQDGINYIDDIERLVAAGLIVPLSSSASRIVVVMRNGSMPPPSSGLPPVKQADIEVVANYIDNPRYWPEFLPPDVTPPDAADAGTALPPAVDAGADGG
jgi:mono/diheme cytochrome c family protein